MANTVHHASEEQPLEKVVWGYVGTGVLWISLLLSGMALERLGLSSNILSGILPGETGNLHTQVTELTRALGEMKNERDTNKLIENGLRVKAEKLEKQLAATPVPSTPVPSTPVPSTTTTP